MSLSYLLNDCFGKNTLSFFGFVSFLNKICRDRLLGLTAYLFLATLVFLTDKS